MSGVCLVTSGSTVDSLNWCGVISLCWDVLKALDLVTEVIQCVLTEVDETRYSHSYVFVCDMVKGEVN